MVQSGLTFELPLGESRIKLNDGEAVQFGVSNSIPVTVTSDQITGTAARFTVSGSASGIAVRVENEWSYIQSFWGGFALMFGISGFAWMKKLVRGIGSSEL